MRPTIASNDIIRQLQKEVLSLQGFKRMPGSIAPDAGLGAIAHAFPERTFPIVAVHEFISPAAAEAAATNGFISGILGKLMQQGGTCLWISDRRTIYPPALTLFGIHAERIIFLDLDKQKDVLWAIEEALKCEALTAVVGELRELSFTASRRLQLAVEQSRVTGLIHRYQPRSENTVACVSRWKIRPLPSVLEDGMPGIGLPRWNVNLTKIRNGKPDTWQVEWSNGSFRLIPERFIAISNTRTLKTG